MPSQKKHSLEELIGLQKKLEDTLADHPGVNGVGIGMNANRSDYAFKVLIDDEEVAENLPSHIEDVEIVFEVTGAIEAL
jgi:hypothetical protein